MKRLFIRLFSILTLTCLMFALTPIASASAEQVEEKDGESYSNSQESEWKICSFVPQADLPHISGSSNRRAVHAHGYWINNTCKIKNMKAKVTIHLERRLSSKKGSWKRVTRPTSGNVWPGGGKGRRITAHYECKGYTRYDYRAIVDVDVIGYRDSPQKGISRINALPCG